MANTEEVDSFLSDDFLRGLDQLQILTRKKINTSGPGIHLTWKSGGSLEFLDYRKYQPGDDLRYVDWNVYGRLDRLFIKLFQAEKDLVLNILIDTSLSMGIGSPSKLIFAKKIAAALGYIGLSNNDHVGISAFNDSIAFSKSPEKGPSTYLSLLGFLKKLTCRGKTDLSSVIMDFATATRQQGILVIISDLLDPGGFEKGLRFINRKKTDVIVIQVLDKKELVPEKKGHFNLVDIETGESRRLSLDDDLIERYKKNMTERIKKTNDFCADNGVTYTLVETDRRFEDFLIDILAAGNIVV